MIQTLEREELPRFQSLAEGSVYNVHVYVLCFAYAMCMYVCMHSSLQKDMMINFHILCHCLYARRHTLRSIETGVEYSITVSTVVSDQRFGMSSILTAAAQPVRALIDGRLVCSG